MPHLFICHAHVTNVPQIIGTSVRDPYILVRSSPALYTTYRDRTRFFLLRDLVLAMVCVKKTPLVYSSLRRAHATVTRSRHAITITNMIDSRAHLTTVCCQEKWSGKYLPYRTGGYGPALWHARTHTNTYILTRCGCHNFVRMGGHQNAMGESDGGMLITMHSRLVDCAISSMDSIRMLTYTTTVGEKRMLVPVLECGELYSYKVSSFRWFDKTWKTRVTKKVRLGTPLERNSLITILANRAAKHYIIHLLPTIFIRTICIGF